MVIRMMQVLSNKNNEFPDIVEVLGTSDTSKQPKTSDTVSANFDYEERKTWRLRLLSGGVIPNVNSSQSQTSNIETLVEASKTQIKEKSEAAPEKVNQTDVTAAENMRQLNRLFIYSVL